MNWRIVAVAALGAATAAAAQQPFDLDPTFRTEIDAINVNDVLPLPGGDIMISGQIRFPGDMYSRGYARLSSTGQRVLPYPEFSPGGGRMTPWGSDQFYVQNGDGVRLINFDGTVDTGFNMINTPYYYTIQGGQYHVFPDGSLLWSGYHHLTDTARGFVGWYGLAWITAHGDLDTTKIHRQSEGTIMFLKPVQDGKFMCSGGGGMVEGRPSSTIFRVHADGALDTTFNAPYLQLGAGYDYKPLADGKILAGGYFRFVGSTDTLSLVRFLPDGQVDPTFHSAYFEATYNTYAFPIVDQITPLGPDRYILTGNFNSIDGEQRGGIAIIDTSGHLMDDHFTGSGCGGFVWPLWPPGLEYDYRSVVGITPLPDGNYYIYGSYHGYDDGTTNDTLQRMVSRLHGLNVGVEEVEVPAEKPLTIYPNPASLYATLAYDFKAAPDKAYLGIRDVVGKEVQRLPIQAAEGQTVWDTRSISPGAYTVELVNGGRTLGTAKLIVKR